MCRPRLMASQPSLWAAVGASNAESNQAWVAGENRSGTPSGYGDGVTDNMQDFRRLLVIVSSTWEAAAGRLPPCPPAALPLQSAARGAWGVWGFLAGRGFGTSARR